MHILVAISPFATGLAFSQGCVELVYSSEPGYYLFERIVRYEHLAGNREALMSNNALYWQIPDW